MTPQSLFALTQDGDHREDTKNLGLDKVLGNVLTLTRIMQQVQGFCMSVEQACVSNSIA